MLDVAGSINTRIHGLTLLAPLSDINKTKYNLVNIPLVEAKILKEDLNNELVRMRI